MRTASWQAQATRAIHSCSKQVRYGQVDRGRSGFLTPEAIHAFLADVGLEATPFDMRHIMAELDPEHTGIVSRASFISFIRYGGQHAPPPKVGWPRLVHACLPIARPLPLRL